MSSGAFLIQADLDRIDALAGEREMEWWRIGAAGFLSDYEKREALGYAGRGRKRDYGCGDADSKYRADQARDDRGRWEFEGGVVNESSENIELVSGLSDYCEKEWQKAREDCRILLLLPNPPRGLTGGYRDVERCARGLVSVQCGGNPIFTL